MNTGDGLDSDGTIYANYKGQLSSETFVVEEKKRSFMDS